MVLVSEARLMDEDRAWEEGRPPLDEELLVCRKMVVEDLIAVQNLHVSRQQGFFFLPLLYHLHSCLVPLD